MIGLASLGADAKTAALFRDDESSTSTVQSGTLDLTLDGNDGTVTFLSETSVGLGDSGQATLTVANVGSLTGYLDVEVASLTNYENGISGNENSADNTGGDPGQGNGELQDHLEVAATFSSGPDLWTGFDVVASKLGAGTVYDLDYELPGGGSDTFVLDWQLPSDTSTEAESDSVEFALTFRLDQAADAGV